MITAEISPSVEAVARHYDQLDTFYREIWGEHVHHGLWLTGRESPNRAVIRLAERVAELAQVHPGSTLCDVGCGYGATARLLATRYGAQVTAMTVTPAQFEYARSLQPRCTNPDYRLGDWLENDLPASSFDAVIAIESTEHMADKARAFREAARVLKPCGSLVVCAWLASEQAKPWQVRHLLRPICAEGRLAGMGTEQDYRQFLEAAGLHVCAFQDLSSAVRRTWSVCLGRLLRALWRQPAYRRFLLDREHQDRVFALTLLRIRLAYATGAMRYGLFAARRL